MPPRLSGGEGPEDEGAYLLQAACPGEGEELAFGVGGSGVGTGGQVGAQRSAVAPETVALPDRLQPAYQKSL